MLCTNSILFITLNYVLTQTPHQAMINWINLVTICPILIILMEIELREFTFIIKGLYLLKCQTWIQECICFDLKIGSKCSTIVSLYRSPNQSPDEIEIFLNKLNLTMESITQKNPSLTVVISNFYARSSKWWTDDKATQKGLKIKNLLSQFSLSPVINKPTHISQNFNFYMICCLQINKI